MRVVVFSALAFVLAACGGAAEPAPASPPPPASASGGSVAANQQGRIDPGLAGPLDSSAAAPSQADVLGRSGYGGAGYGSGTGGGSGSLIGGDREHPVPTCGPDESYLWVARDFHCPGGGNPLQGDPARGQAARVGNVGPHAHTSSGGDPFADAHIVDLYEIPCPRGPVQVFVCMYHCPAGRSPM
jgi:hypothetical protein